jgi:sigma-E factor negative regulatory protein RseB
VGDIPPATAQRIAQSVTFTQPAAHSTEVTKP